MYVCVLIKTSCQKKSENMRRLDYYTCWSKVKGKRGDRISGQKKKGPIVEFCLDIKPQTHPLTSLCVLGELLATQTTIGPLTAALGYNQSLLILTPLPFLLSTSSCFQVCLVQASKIFNTCNANVNCFVMNDYK